MDTAQTRWAARHKQHIGQEACFFGNRLPASFYNPAQPPVAPRVADKADTADTEPPAKKALSGGHGAACQPRFRRKRKALQLAKALVSMLALETAMLEQFGENDGEHFRAVMTGCTGVGVYLMILGMAVYMIYTSGKKIKNLERNLS